MLVDGTWTKLPSSQRSFPGVLDILATFLYNGRKWRCVFIYLLRAGHSEERTEVYLSCYTHTWWTNTCVSGSFCTTQSHTLQGLYLKTVCVLGGLSAAHHKTCESLTASPVCGVIQLLSPPRFTQSVCLPWALFPGFSHPRVTFICLVTVMGLMISYQVKCDLKSSQIRWSYVFLIWDKLCRFDSCYSGRDLT